MSYKAVRQCVGQESNLHSVSAGGLRPLRLAGAQPTRLVSTLDGIRTHALHGEGVATTPGWSARAFPVAQGGVEPPASLGLSKGGLPVAYRAARPRTLLGQRKGRESNPQGSSLVRVRTGCRRQSACPSVSVWMAGFEPACSGFRRRRMKPGSPTSRSSSVRTNKKSQGRVTPGRPEVRPIGSGVSVARDRRQAAGADNRPGPSSSSRTNWRDRVPSCLLLQPPGTETLASLLVVSVADIW